MAIIKKPYIQAGLFWIVYDMRGNVVDVSYDDPLEYYSDDDYVVKRQIVIDVDDWNYLKQFTANEEVEKQEPF